MTHTMIKASAQIKSALMLAGLNIHGTTKIIENKITRDHTENLMKYLNIKFDIKKLKDGGKEITINGPYEIKSKNLTVPGDPSSAAFFVVGALIVPNSKIILKNVMLDQLVQYYIKILKKMGGKIKIKKTKKLSGENVGEIHVKYSQLKGVNIEASLAPQLIDEYQIISIAATQAKGRTTMKGLSELRHKESDRIKSIVYNLKKIGFRIKSIRNDIVIKGGVSNLKKKTNIRTFNDHRIAMSFLILKLVYKEKIIVDNEKCISISYPEFEEHLDKLIVNHNG